MEGRCVGSSVRFGLLKAVGTVVCLMVLQFVFLFVLALAEFGRSGRAVLRAENVSVSLLDARVSGVSAYRIEFDVVQVGGEPVGAARVVVKTANGDAIFETVLAEDVTHCVQYLASRPSGISVSGLPGSSVNLSMSASFFRPTNVLLTGCLATLVVTAIAVLSRKGYGVVFPLRGAPLRLYGSSVAVLGGFYLLKVGIFWGLALLIGGGGVDSSTDEVVGFFRAAAVDSPAVLFVCSVFAAPVLEELLFRAFMLGRMLSERGPVVSIVSTSILFGVVHSGMNQIATAGLLGFVCGYVFYRTRSVLLCIFVHLVNNLVAFGVVMGISGKGMGVGLDVSLMVVSGGMVALGGALIWRGVTSLQGFSAEPKWSFGRCCVVGGGDLKKDGDGFVP